MYCVYISYLSSLSMGLGPGKLTQLLALTGSDGTWRKTLADKAIAWVLIISDSSFSLSVS